MNGQQPVFSANGVFQGWLGNANQLLNQTHSNTSPPVISPIATTMDISNTLYQRIVNQQLGSLEFYQSNPMNNGQDQFYSNVSNIANHNQNMMTHSAANNIKCPQPIRPSDTHQSSTLRNDEIYYQFSNPLLYMSNMNTQEAVNRHINGFSNNTVMPNENSDTRNRSSQCSKVPIMLTDQSAQNLKTLSRIPQQTNANNSLSKLSISKQEGRKIKTCEKRPRAIKNEYKTAKERKTRKPKLFSKFVTGSEIYKYSVSLEDKKVSEPTMAIVCSSPSNSSKSPSGSMLSARSNSTPGPTYDGLKRNAASCVIQPASSYQEASVLCLSRSKQNREKHESPSSSKMNNLPLKKRLIMYEKPDNDQIVERVEKDNSHKKPSPSKTGIIKSKPFNRYLLKIQRDCANDDLTITEKLQGICEKRSDWFRGRSSFFPIPKTFLPMERTSYSDDSDSDDGVMIIDSKAANEQNDSCCLNNI